MGNGYTRQSAAEILDGQDIIASPLNAEFDAIRDAFDSTSGHSHDGTTGEGPLIDLNTSITGVLPVVNGGTGGINKVDGTAAPAATNDNTEGYAVGSVWVDTVANRSYVCVDSTTDAAVWFGGETLDADLQAISALSTTGVLVRSAANTWVLRTISGSGAISVTNGDGVSGNPTISVVAATTSVAGTMSPTDKAKLDGIASGATANSSDATLLARANHTGEQAISTITGLQAELDSKLEALGTVDLTTDVTGILPIANGGTNSSTASGARTNLGLGSLATASTINNANWSGTDLAVANGGTGASDASGARTNLGLGSLATQDVPNVSSVDGTLPVTNGGTGSTTASGARTNLSVPSTSITITAGNGLTGGGSLAANRTITLGTPTTVTGSTGNTVTTTGHTHALTLASGDITGALGFTPAARVDDDVYPIGTLVFAWYSAGGSSSVANGATTSGANLTRPRMLSQRPAGGSASAPFFDSGGVVLSGTWENVSGQTIYSRGSILENESRQVGGYWARTS